MEYYSKCLELQYRTHIEIIWAFKMSFIFSSDLSGGGRKIINISWALKMSGADNM